MSKLHAPHHFNEEGYTLTELLVAMAVMSILLIGMMTFLATSIMNNSISGTRADLLREAHLAVDLIIRDIRLSANVDANNSIADDNSPDAINTSGFGWESDAETLVLATASQDTSNNILFADAAHYITEKNNIIYYINDSTLYKRTLAAEVANNSTITSCPPDSATNDCPADRLNVQNVQNLTFRYFDATNTEVTPNLARSVEVDLTLQTTKYGRPIEVSYSTRTVFRNE